MKSSEVLRAALERMDGGKKWHQGWYCNETGTKFCSLGAMREVLNVNFDSFPARWRLEKAVADFPKHTISDWNDHAADFSVIEQGFQKAIALAEAEGD